MLSFSTSSLLLTPLLITNIVWTSVEFRCVTFALLLKIKHAESWPFVCSDFYSADSRHGLEIVWKHSFPWKTHHSDILRWESSLSCFSAPFWVSIDHIFISMSVALFKGKVKLLSTKKRERERAPSTFCIDLFLEDAVFFCLFDQMSRNPGVQPCSSDITMAPLSCPVFPKLVTTVRFSVALWHAAIFFVLRTCLGWTDFCSSSVFDWKWVTLYW